MRVQTTSRILAVLRVSLHLLVAVLLLVGMLGDFTPLALLFAAVYLAGTVAHNRGMEYSARASWAWLAIITGLLSLLHI